MHIISLDLENTKSYASAHIDFTEGTNAIVGQNGAGKSTILEAIGFALFAHLPYKQEDFVREGARSASVTVTFASGRDERHYQVVRRCGSVTQHYIYDPELGVRICEGRADVQSFLQEHLGVDVATDLGKLFSDAVGVPQGTLTSAFLQTPANRKPIFDPLLRVEEYRKAFDALAEPRRLLRQQQQQLEVEIGKLQTRVESLPDLEKLTEQLHEEIASAVQTLSETAAELAVIQAKRQEMDTLRQQITDLRSQYLQAAQQVDSLQKQLAGAERALAESVEASQIVARHRSGHDAYVAAQARQKELDQEVRLRRAQENRFAELDRTLSVAQSELAGQAEQLEEADAAERTAAGLSPAVQQQTQLEDELVAAQQQVARLQDAQTELAHLQAELERLQERQATLSQQLDQAATLEAAQEIGQTTIESLRVRLIEQRDLQTRTKVEMDTLHTQIEALEVTEGAVCPVCEQPLPTERRDALLERNRERLNTLAGDLNCTDALLHKDQKELAAQEKEQKRRQQAVHQLPRPAELNSLQEQLEEHRQRLAAAKVRVSELTEAPAQVETLQQQLAALDNPRQQQEIAARTAARRSQIERRMAATRQIIEETQSQIAQVQAALDHFADLDGDLEAVAKGLYNHHPAYQQVVAHSIVAQALKARQDEREALRAALAGATESLAAAQDALAELDGQFDQQDYDQIVQQDQALQQRQGSIDTQLRLRRRELEEHTAEIEQLRRWQQQLQEAQTRQEHQAEQQELLEYLRSIVKEAGPYVTRALVHQISHRAAQLFGEIMQDYSRHLHWHEDYNIILDVEGRERQFAQLSGGEQMSAALAVRLALLQELSDISVAFFDEPTTNLDETRRESLARQILEVKGFRQLFVISHDDTFEQATENLVRVQKINGVSIVE